MSPCLSIAGGFLLRLGLMAACNIYKHFLLSQRSDVDASHSLCNSSTACLQSFSEQWGGFAP